MRAVAAVLGALVAAVGAKALKDAVVTDTVYFEVEQGGEKLGRIEIGLFGDDLPRTAANFAALALGAFTSATSGRALAYKGSAFHRVIPDFMVQGGDFTAHNGTGGESIYGPSFDDEAFPYKHDARGLLSMANAGPNTNGSQFFVTTVLTPWLDGKHVVFGRVTSGMKVVDAISAVKRLPGDRPAVPVVIAACGLVGEMSDALKRAIPEALRAQQPALFASLSADDKDERDL